MKKLDISRIANQIEINYASIKEQGLETFLELAQKNPQEAIARFSEFMKRTLDSGKGIFQGIGCGGPAQEVSVPMLNVIGSFYAKLPRELKEKALRECLSFIDGKYNTLIASTVVERIHEPHLVGDIVINRGIYWPGFEIYVDRLKGKSLWSEVEPEVITGIRDEGLFLKLPKASGVLDVPSTFWFTFPLLFKKYSTKNISQGFRELFPDIIDRTLDARAGLIAVHSAYDNFREESERAPYIEGISKRLEEVHDYLRPNLIRKINAQNWILLDDPYQPRVKQARDFLQSEEARLPDAN